MDTLMCADASTLNSSADTIKKVEVKKEEVKKTPAEKKQGVKNIFNKGLDILNKTVADVKTEKDNKAVLDTIAKPTDSLVSTQSINSLTSPSIDTTEVKWYKSAWFIAGVSVVVVGGALAYLKFVKKLF